MAVFTGKLLEKMVNEAGRQSDAKRSKYLWCEECNGEGKDWWYGEDCKVCKGDGKLRLKFK